MAENCKVSVIVPIYNTAAYLEACVGSVIRQKCFSECEVLLVDDGSTDGSAEIIDAYEKQYENVRCLRYDAPPRNRGESAARNLGLKNAWGDAVFFLDSDDSLSEGYLDALLAKMAERDCDVVYAGYSRRTEDRIEPVHRAVLGSDAVVSGAEHLAQRLSAEDQCNYIWCALYRSAFLRENGIAFCESVRLYEDMLFTTKAAIAAPRVCTLSEYGYLYRVRSGSLTQNGIQRADVENVLDVLERCGEEEKNSPQPQLWERFRYQLISMCLYYVGVLWDRREIDGDERARFYRRLEKSTSWKALWSAAVTCRERVKWLLWRIDRRLFYPLVRRKG